MPKYINCKLTNSTERTKIDIEYYVKFKKYNWQIDSNGYIYTMIRKDSKPYKLFLAHYIKDFDPSLNRDLTCDHKNRIKTDNRWKNLRITDYIIQSKNKSFKNSNTGVPGIYQRKNRKSYIVSYSIKGMPYHKEFCWSKNKLQQIAWEEAKEFNEYIRTTEPEYREAKCLSEEEESGCSSIEEEDYDQSFNLDLLLPFNTSGYLHISDSKSRNEWIVKYIDKEGFEMEKRFKYNINDKYIVLKQAKKFKDKKEKYRHLKTGKRRGRKNKCGYENIHENGNFWKVKFYDEEGESTSKSFGFGPLSKKSKKEAFEECLIFRFDVWKDDPKKRQKYKDEMDKYFHNCLSKISIKDIISKKNNNENDILPIDKDINLFQLPQFEKISKNINNDLQIDYDIPKIQINNKPKKSLIKGVHLDIEKNMYTVIYNYLGFSQYKEFPFGKGKFDWCIAKEDAENFKLRVNYFNKKSDKDHNNEETNSQEDDVSGSFLMETEETEESEHEKIILQKKKTKNNYEKIIIQNKKQKIIAVPRDQKLKNGEKEFVIIDNKTKFIIVPKNDDIINNNQKKKTNNNDEKSQDLLLL